jgi:hypothetical protein
MRRLLWYGNSSGSDRKPNSSDNPVCLSVQSYGTYCQQPQGPVFVFNAKLRRVHFPIGYGSDTMNSCIVIILAVAISQKRATLVEEYIDAIHEHTVSPLSGSGGW